MATCSAIPWDWVSATGKDNVESPSLCEMSTPLDIDAEEDEAVGGPGRDCMLSDHLDLFLEKYLRV